MTTVGLMPEDVVFEVVDPRAPEALAAVNAYFTEIDERFIGGFDAGDALAHDAPRFRPPTGWFLVARRAGVVVACGGVTMLRADTAEIKRMWVAPAGRCAGLGGRLLTQLERTAAGAGAVHVVLDTNSVLTEALALYERSGYLPTERYGDNPYAHHWFTKVL